MARISFIGLSWTLLVLQFVAANKITWDYVISGAGTAGMLLATILSEDPNVKVLVLEAGADGRTQPNITNPERRGTIQKTEYDWQLWTQPQPGLYDNGTAGAQYVPRGKTIGGTSAMNWMIHNEDSRIQLDIWESLLNLTGWNWETMSTAFRQSEIMYAPPAYEAQYLPYDASLHGGVGPISSTYQRSVLNLFHEYLTPTLNAAGYGLPKDGYGGEAVGPNYLAFAIEPLNYTRSFSGSAYTAVQSRPNLQVLIEAQVARIDWGSGKDGLATASGVEYIDTSSGSNSTQYVSAREVILSSGVIQSPQILQLSGIGDPSVISKVGIEPVVNLSANLIDLESAEAILPPAEYAIASAFLNSTDSIPGVDDTQLAVYKHLWFTKQPLFEMAWQYKVANVTPYNLFPLSQGTVLINSSDPLAPPAIDPHYNRVKVNLTSYGEVDWDLWLLVKATQHYTTQLATTAPLSNIVISTVPAWNASFSDFYDAVFRQTGSSQHLTGGCPMLPRNRGGVVDNTLKVYGTSNVRVVDGSVFPYQPSAHPMGVTYAIAMRAARIFQLERSQGDGMNSELLTKSLQLPASNASASLTAMFPDSTTEGMAGKRRSTYLQP